MSIDLNKYCDPDNPRCVRPFVQDGYEYATDGRVCVRVKTDKQPIKDPNFHHPNAAGLQWSDFDNAEWRKWEPIEIQYIQRKCVECNGTGRGKDECPNCFGTGEVECGCCGSEIECDECDGDGESRSIGGDVNCEECNGTGKESVEFTYDFGDAAFNGKFLAHINEWDNAEYAISSSNKPMLVRADCVEAMIMPLCIKRHIEVYGDNDVIEVRRK